MPTRLLLRVANKRALSAHRPHSKKARHKPSSPYCTDSLRTLRLWHPWIFQSRRPYVISSLPFSNPTFPPHRNPLQRPPTIIVQDLDSSSATSTSQMIIDITETSTTTTQVDPEAIVGSGDTRKQLRLVNNLHDIG